MFRLVTCELAVVSAALMLAGSAWGQSDGPIVAWGAGQCGGTGNFDFGQSCVPAPNTTFVAIDSAGGHSLGLKADGSIVAWGWNGYGQNSVPVPNTGFVAVADGWYHSLGLKTDSSIVAWGSNGYGQCNVPVPNTDFVALAGGAEHSLGLKVDASIVAWGRNNYGQRSVPAPNTGFVAVAAGSWHSLGLKADGSVVAWGAGTTNIGGFPHYGQAIVPAPNTGFVAVAGGGYHSLGLKAGGSIVAWGRNNYGQCNVPAPNTGFVAVSAGWYHSLGLKADGSIVAWGWNDEGQCSVPTPNTGFVAVAAGGKHSLAIGADGSDCGPGLIADCNGNCAPISWLGDGICDDGRYTYNGVPIHFDCPQFNNDNGDCDAPAPPIEDPPNHGQSDAPPNFTPPPPPTPGQTKLLLITHGWNTSQEKFESYWQPMADALAGQVGPEWKVHAYNWAADSGSLSLSAGPDYALVMGIAHGYALGDDIAAQGYQHVHLVAHSAGSALISAASASIRRAAREEMSIHTTYLDAYAGTIIIEGLSFRDAYGGWSDWSEQYFSREIIYAVGCGAMGTGWDTQLHLPESFNVDVSRVDPDFTLWCLSSHGWPVCFYHNTVDSDVSLPDCDPPNGSTLSYGWPLSYAMHGGDVADWITEMNDAYPKGEKRILSGGRSLTGVATPAPPTFFERDDPPIDLAAVPSFVSAPAAVAIDAAGFTATTAPDGAAAWVNFQITTDAPINFIRFDLEFLSDPPAAGLVALYVNGSQRRGVVDEPYTLPGPGAYAMPTPGELAPGQHIVSFRLDQFGDVPSTVRIENVATGLGKFVYGQEPAGAAEIETCPADIDGDGAVGLGDLSILLTNFGTIGGATHAMGDINGDGNVDLADLSLLLEAFGTACE